MKISFKTLSVLALGIGCAFGACAQTQAKSKIVFPKDLNWQTMTTIAFNLDSPDYKEGTSEQRQLATVIWGETINGFPANSISQSGGKFPAFVNIASFESGGIRYIFTILDAASSAYPSCEDPPNGSSASIIYSRCPMRVVIEDKATGHSTNQDFPEYCSMTTNYRDQPKTKNYQQIAIDVKKKMAYARVIQYGKPAPE
jgi:hypothetical protein